jgi:hypothetical protein
MDGPVRVQSKSRNFVSPLFFKATQTMGNLTLRILHQEFFFLSFADIKEGKKKVLDEIAVSLLRLALF